MSSASKRSFYLGFTNGLKFLPSLSTPKHKREMQTQSRENPNKKLFYVYIISVYLILFFLAFFHELLNSLYSLTLLFHDVVLFFCLFNEISWNFLTSKINKELQSALILWSKVREIWIGDRKSKFLKRDYLSINKKTKEYRVLSTRLYYVLIFWIRLKFRARFRIKFRIIPSVWWCIQSCMTI